MSPRCWIWSYRFGICSAGFQPCFSLVFLCYLSFLHFGIAMFTQCILGKHLTIFCFVFNKGSQLWVCLKSQNTLWTLNNTGMVKTMGLVQSEWIHPALWNVLNLGEQWQNVSLIIKISSTLMFDEHFISNWWHCYRIFRKYDLASSRLLEWALKVVSLLLTTAQAFCYPIHWDVNNVLQPPENKPSVTITIASKLWTKTKFSSQVTSVSYFLTATTKVISVLYVGLYRFT